MAKFTITFENGQIKKELTFRGEVFNNTMQPWEGGCRTSSGKAFNYQYEEKYPEDENLEEISREFYELSFAEDDEIEEALEKLAEFE